MASTRQDLMDAVVGYLQDGNNAIAGFVDSVQVKAYEYDGEVKPYQAGRALVSIPNNQIPARASSGNRDEVYPIYVSLGILVKSHEEGTGDLQAALTTIREELDEHFTYNRTKLWSYFTDTDGVVLSTNFNRVELGGVQTFIADDGQNATIDFNIHVHLTRDVS